jgi:hypothetical protein
MNGTSTPFASLVALTLTAAVAGAQTPAPAPIPIRDNSFLFEVAYNQEWGVVQHISTFHRVRRSVGWEATFTQEWPAPSERHQLSYTVPIQRSMTAVGEKTGIGDLMLNWRYQIPMRKGSLIAASPRLSVVLPTGREEWGHGSGSAGLELNLPLSIELSPWLVSHTNVGGGWTPSARNELGDRAGVRGVFVGQSLIWLVHPKFNVMLESIWNRDELVVGEDQTSSERGFLVSPGFRAAFDLPSGLQIVPGIAVPIGVGPSDGQRGVFVYLSFEHPFRKQ